MPIAEGLRCDRLSGVPVEYHDEVGGGGDRLSVHGCDEVLVLELQRHLATAVVVVTFDGGLASGKAGRGAARDIGHLAGGEECPVEAAEHCGHRFGVGGTGPLDGSTDLD